MSETSPRPPEAAGPAAIMLPERALVAISGADAAHFLHNLLTANIEALAPGEGRPAALLTPQGKIVADILIFNASDEEPLYLIDVGRGFAEDLVTKLARYKLRAAVSVDPVGAPVAVMACLDCGAGEDALLHDEAVYTFRDPRHAALGHRLYGPEDRLAAIAAKLGRHDRDYYHARRVALGIPEGGQDFLPSDRFPHDINLDQLGGIDFAKGCYIGQEVVSRMQHRGSARTRALIMRCLNGFGIVGGVDIRGGEKLIGKTGECYRDRAIALVRTDKLEEIRAEGEILTAGGVEVELIKPEYAKF